MKLLSNNLILLIVFLLSASNVAVAQNREISPRDNSSSPAVGVSGQMQVEDRNLPSTRQVMPRGQRQQIVAGAASPDRRLTSSQSYTVTASVVPKEMKWSPVQQQWLLGIHHDPAPAGIRVRQVIQNTPATRMIGYTNDGRKVRFQLDPGDYIIDVNGHPVGQHNGFWYDFSSLLNDQANNPMHPNDIGWVNLGVFDSRKRTVTGFWVQLDPRH